VFAGKLHNPRTGAPVERKDAITALQQRGGKHTGRVSSNTDFVVVGAFPGDKFMASVESQRSKVNSRLQVISYSDFLALELIAPVAAVAIRPPATEQPAPPQGHENCRIFDCTVEHAYRCSECSRSKKTNVFYAKSDFKLARGKHTITKACKRCGDLAQRRYMRKKGKAEPKVCSVSVSVSV
jgi:hypothetical protein